MLNQKILDYVDNVVSNIDASDEQRVHIENELIRYLIESSENTSIEEVKNSLSSPEKFAEELSKRLSNANLNGLKPGTSEHIEKRRTVHHQRYAGEFMQERSNVNIKLLYIPLLQISSGTQRLIMPLTDEDEDEED